MERRTTKSVLSRSSKLVCALDDRALYMSAAHDGTVCCFTGHATVVIETGDPTGKKLLLFEAGLWMICGKVDREARRTRGHW